MQISNVKIESYRSIRSLDLDCDRSVVVLEGRNDTGKSSILEAIDRCIRAIAGPLNAKFSLKLLAEELPEEWPSRGFGQDSRAANFIREGSQAAKVVVRIRLSDEEVGAMGCRATAPQLGPPLPANLKEFTVTWVRGTGQVIPAMSAEDRLRSGFAEESGLRSFVQKLGSLFRLVGPQRLVINEGINVNQRPDPPPAWNDHNLKGLLFGYKNHERAAVQLRYERLRDLARGTLIGDLLVGARQQQLFARTKVGEMVLDLEDRSTGVQQLLAVLAATVCNEGQVVAIEEPELNLSLELQKSLWSDLRRLVADGTLKQVFVTSHSPLFELEAERIRVEHSPSAGTTCTRLEPRPAQGVLPELKEGKVTRDRMLELPAETAQRLGLTSEGGSVYLYTRPDQVGVRLLSEEEIGRMASGEFKLEDLA